MCLACDLCIDAAQLFQLLILSGSGAMIASLFKFWKK